ncbi:MAG: hypothetical protein AAF483_19110 [Planctomycetota bacterium]
MRYVAFFAVFAMSMLGGIAYLNPKIMRAYMLPWFYGPVSEVNPTLDWPAKIDQPYPNLELYDTDGKSLRLSDFRGQVLILHSVGMSCKACQAFSGGHEVGGLGGTVPLQKLKSFKSYFKKWTNTEFEDSRFKLVQIIFYGPDAIAAPTLEEAQQWAEHFGPALPKGTKILFADSSMLSRDTRGMIPCFQLVDQNFILRCDAGNEPRSDVFEDLLPLLKRAL